MAESVPPSGVKYRDKSMNANTLVVLNQILKDGLQMLGDTAESKGMLGEDVIDHRSAEYLAKSWGLDWINKTPEEMEAELENEDEDEGEDDEEEEEDPHAEEEMFGQRAGFREPNFSYDYGFNPLVALGEFVRMKHPRVRLRRVVSATRAFHLQRPHGIRAVTFVGPSLCSVETTAQLAEEALKKARLAAAPSSEGVAADDAAVTALATAEAVWSMASQALATSQAAGGSDKDVSKMIDPRLGPHGVKQSEHLAAELASLFDGSNGLHKGISAGLEKHRKSYLIKNKMLMQGPFDLLVCSPLSSCMETSQILAKKFGGTLPRLVATPLLAATAVASKNETDAREKKDALLPARKGRSLQELKEDFPEQNIYIPLENGVSVEEAKEEEVPNATLRWDFSALEGSHKTWRSGSSKPGWYNPSRLNGPRCEESIDWLSDRIEKNILVVGQHVALSKLLGVTPSLFNNKGIIRRQIGSEMTWSLPLILPNRKGESNLVNSLMNKLLPLLCDGKKIRGFVGYALHFEHSDDEVLIEGQDEPDDAPISSNTLSANPHMQKVSSPNGYESYGRTYDVHGCLHLSFASQGFAAECSYNAELKQICDQVVDGAIFACAPNAATAKKTSADHLARQASGEEKPCSLMNFATKIDKWPPCLPGQGSSLLPTQSNSASCTKPVAKAATYIRFKFRTSNHAVQGRKAYREKVVEHAAAVKGFIQSWIEVEENGTTRVTILWDSVQIRDSVFGVVNEQFASALSHFAVTGSLVISRGRTIAPNTLPDDTDRGLSVPDSS